MKHLMLIVAALAAVTGCAGHKAREDLNIPDPSVARGGFGTPQDAAAGAALKTWTDIYTPVKQRGAALDALQLRLDRVGSGMDAYAGAQAQCWIDAGREELVARDEWGFVEEAIGEATALIGGIESGQAQTARSTALRTAVQVRPDLWRELAVLKADARFAACPQAQKLAACAEVGLTHAGHEAWTRAFAKAQQRTVALQMPIRDAAQALSACTVSAPAPHAQLISLSADALFAFDRGDVAALNPAGRTQLERTAAQLRALGPTEQLVVSGYTDRLGASAYNQRLSRQRAETVARYLRGEGVRAPIDARGFGGARPGTICTMRDRAALIDCLAPDRRVEIRIVGAVSGSKKAVGKIANAGAGAEGVAGFAASAASAASAAPAAEPAEKAAMPARRTSVMKSTTEARAESDAKSADDATPRGIVGAAINTRAADR